MRLSHQETPQEIFERLEYQSSKYNLIHFNAIVTNTPTGTTIKVDDEHEFWYHQLVGKCIDIDELKVTLMDTDWSTYFKDLEEGLYDFKLLLSAEHDSDEYRSWHYYVAEHAECEFICSFDTHLAQLEQFETLTSEDLFSF